MATRLSRVRRHDRSNALQRSCVRTPTHFVGSIVWDGSAARTVAEVPAVLAPTTSIVPRVATVALFAPQIVMANSADQTDAGMIAGRVKSGQTRIVPKRVSVHA